METLIGFAVGFLVGTQQGRDGLERLRANVEAISRSPEVHHLLRTGLAVASAAARQVMTTGGGALVSGAVNTLGRKANDSLAGRRQGAW
jgi:hypothetical protein